MASNSTSASGLGIYDDPNNYDLSDEEIPKSKRPAYENTVTMVANNGQRFKVCSSQVLFQPGISTPTNKSPRKRPEPTEGYIYGFILPFTVSNPEYLVVKIGKTGAGKVGRRLRDHNSEFFKATNGIQIFNELISPTTPDEVINDLVKWKEQAKVFLLSYIKDGLREAESGARTCIGVVPFDGSKFKKVFPNSEKVTTTEWVVAKNKVVEDIQIAFWHNELEAFDTADAFLEKLKELNKREHVNLTISLQLTHIDDIKVPKYIRNSGP